MINCEFLTYLKWINNYIYIFLDIKGCLKRKFKSLLSFLVGLLVQDKHKIFVRISRYDENKNYDKGTYLKIMRSILQQSRKYK